MTELPDAYSRVTNPERFHALILHALAAFDHLRVTYEVTERSTFDPLPIPLAPFEHARPPIMLIPAGQTRRRSELPLRGFLASSSGMDAGMRRRSRPAAVMLVMRTPVKKPYVLTSWYAAS